jgi:hypothetical protein
MTPKSFQALTRRESVAVLNDAIQWLVSEMVITLTMPNCPFKSRRLAELQARDESLARELERWSKKQG